MQKIQFHPLFSVSEENESGNPIIVFDTKFSREEIKEATVGNFCDYLYQAKANLSYLQEVCYPLLSGKITELCSKLNSSYSEALEILLQEGFEKHMELTLTELVRVLNEIHYKLIPSLRLAFKEQGRFKFQTNEDVWAANSTQS